MKAISSWLLASLFCCALASLFYSPPAAVAGEAPLLSAERTITIRLQAPPEIALALFGPVEEEKWAPDWQPSFLYRTGPAAHPSFAVFTNGPAEDPSTWVLSSYDPARGYLQYVSLRPAKMVTVISVRCTAGNGDTTRARITYRRTALRPESNAAIEHFASGFTAQAPHWQQHLNEYLRNSANQPPRTK